MCCDFIGDSFLKLDLILQARLARLAILTTWEMYAQQIIFSSLLQWCSLSIISVFLFRSNLNKNIIRRQFHLLPNYIWFCPNDCAKQIGPGLHFYFLRLLNVLLWKHDSLQHILYHSSIIIPFQFQSFLLSMFCAQKIQWMEILTQNNTIFEPTNNRIRNGQNFTENRRTTQEYLHCKFMISQ
jgi:hypothetical protein